MVMVVVVVVVMMVMVMVMTDDDLDGGDELGGFCSRFAHTAVTNLAGERQVPSAP